MLTFAFRLKKKPKKKNRRPRRLRRLCGTGSWSMRRSLFGNVRPRK